MGVLVSESFLRVHMSTQEYNVNKTKTRPNPGYKYTGHHSICSDVHAMKNEVLR